MGPFVSYEESEVLFTNFVDYYWYKTDGAINFPSLLAKWVNGRAHFRNCKQLF